MPTRFSAFSPKRWRRYRQISRILIRHGFGFLLHQAGLGLAWLPWRWRMSPAPPPAHHLRLALEELGPTFIKLGQMLSTRPDLIPPDFVTELIQLQDRVPSFSFEQARRQVEQELGAPLEQLFYAFEEDPLAAASLSQVHAAVLPSGEQVVVKVQRPAIDETIAIDLDILRDLASVAEQQIPRAELYDLCGIVEEFAHTLGGELDFRREGYNAERFRRSFADDAYFYVPRVYWEFSTHRVLTLERVHGIKINAVDRLEAAGLDCHRIALNATRVVVQEVFEEGFFHADPHPGNFFVIPGEVIVAVDFGMVGHISRPLRQELLRLFVVAIRMDTDAVVDQMLRMSMVGRGVDRVGLRRDMERMLQRYAGRPLKEILAREVVDEAMAIAFRRRLRLPAELWLLGKMLGMLEGVGLQLDPDFDPFSAAQPYAERFMQEMLSPAVWAERARSGLKEWGRLLLELPTTVPTLAEQLRQGSLSLGMEPRRLGSLLADLNALSVQMSLGILIAALVVVVALFLQSLLTPGVWWGWLFLGVGSTTLAFLIVLFLWSLRER